MIADVELATTLEALAFAPLLKPKNAQFEQVIPKPELVSHVRLEFFE
jgi:hypothetical protein